MKTLMKILFSAALFAAFSVSAHAEFNFYVKPETSCPPRYFFTAKRCTFDDIFTYKTTVYNDIISNNIPIDTSDLYNSKKQSILQKEASADNSIIVIYRDSGDTTAVICNGKAKVLTKNDFTDYIPANSIFSFSSFISPKIIDAQRILLRININTAWKATAIPAGNVFIYNPATEKITRPAKVLFPGAQDSVYPIVSAGSTISGPNNGYYYMEICGYEYSKAKESGDTTLSASDHYICRYNPADNSFKIIFRDDSLISRKADGTTTEKKSNQVRNSGGYKYGYYWLTSAYDQFYQKNIDTLNVYDSRTDSIYRYDINSVGKTNHNTLVYTSTGLDGTIILSDTRNVLFFRRPDGKISEDTRIYSLFFDSCSTRGSFTGDREGNVFCIFNGYADIFRFSPDGEMINLSLGPETDAEAHLANFNYSSSMQVYEDDSCKYFYCLGARGSDGVTLKFVYDLNYTYSAGVENNPLFSDIHLGNIYPNPAVVETSVTISSVNNLSDAVSSVAIYGENGARIADLTPLLNFNGTDYSLHFNVSNLPAGSYILCARNAKMETSRKFIVK